MNPNKLIQTPQDTEDTSALEADVASSMAAYALENPKMDEFYKQIANDKSSAVSAGMLASQMLLKVRDKLTEAGMVRNNKIWAAQGGVLDSIVSKVAEGVDKYANNMDPEYIGAIREHAIDQLALYDQSSRKVENQRTAQIANPAPQGPRMLPLPVKGV